MSSCTCEPQQRVGGCEICRDPMYGAKLTDREREIVALYGRGYRTTEVAEQLGRSPKTVDTQLGHVQRKLGLTSRSALRRWADIDGARGLLDQAPISWEERSGEHAHVGAMSHRADNPPDLICLSGMFKPEELEALALLARQKR